MSVVEPSVPAMLGEQGPATPGFTRVHAHMTPLGGPRHLAEDKLLQQLSERLG
jgi:hypothetical protein